jgi:hypothetical protein
MEAVPLGVRSDLCFGGGSRPGWVGRRRRCRSGREATSVSEGGSRLERVESLAVGLLAAAGLVPQPPSPAAS